MSAVHFLIIQRLKDVQCSSYTLPGAPNDLFIGFKTLSPFTPGDRFPRAHLSCSAKQIRWVRQSGPPVMETAAAEISFCTFTKEGGLSLPLRPCTHTHTVPPRTHTHPHAQSGGLFPSFRRSARLHIMKQQWGSETKAARVQWKGQADILCPRAAGFDFLSQCSRR